MLPHGLLSAGLGQSQVLCPPQQDRLLILGAREAWILEASAAGLADAEIADALAARFGQPAATFDGPIRDVLGWFDGALAGPGLSAREETLQIAPCPPAAAALRHLQFGDRALTLSAESPEFLAALAFLIDHVPAAKAQGCRHTVHLRGGVSAWTVEVNGSLHSAGQGEDAAAVALQAGLVLAASDLPGRLLELHAAGLVSPRGMGIALIGTGSRGKTTLAAGLMSEGFALLGDDVVPVTMEGEMAGLGTCLCIKKGSWPVLAQRLPGLDTARTISRCGVPVRFVPPSGRRVVAPVPPRLFLFSRYDPTAEPRTRQLGAEQSLERIIAAGALVRDIDQAKLERLAGWVAATPAHEIVYPDLDSGMRVVRQMLGPPL